MRKMRRGLLHFCKGEIDLQPFADLWLLAASYYFYMSWNARYALLILLSTAITYASGLLLERENMRETGGAAAAAPDAKRAAAHLTHPTRRKLIVAASFTLNLAILFYYKYFNFVLGLAARALAFAHISLNVPVFDIMLPVGISFYTFQALSYTMDVYRGEIYAEKNFFRYALFVSFFPQLVAGPIERSKNLLKQLAVPHKLSLANMREGLLLMLWGYFLKIVLADRIAVFVDHVYGNYQDFGGCYLIAATVLFAVQIYCDFAGYSTIAMGAALFLGVRLMENFDAPYLSTSVAEFWQVPEQADRLPGQRALARGVAVFRRVGRAQWAVSGRGRSSDTGEAAAGRVLTYKS